MLLRHANDHRVAKRILLEIELLRDIDHINVVRFHDSGVDGEGRVSNGHGLDSTERSAPLRNIVLEVRPHGAALVGRF